jgi:hypothetical protein
MTVFRKLEAYATRNLSVIYRTVLAGLSPAPTLELESGLEERTLMRPAPLVVCVLTLIIAAWVVVRVGGGLSGDSVSDPVVDTTPPDEATGPPPSASFDARSHDFGEMYVGDSGSHVFTVTNTGAGTLELKVAGSTCLCTIGDLEDLILPPGGSTEATLNWTIKTPNPHFEHSARITTNDPQNRFVSLVVHGHVVSGLFMTPDGEWDFGNVPYDRVATVEGFLLSDISEDLKVNRFESSLPGLTAEFTRLSVAELVEVEHNLPNLPQAEPTGEPILEAEYLKAGYKVRLTVPQDANRGRFQGTVTVHTNLETHPTWNVVVAGMRMGPLQLFPLPGTRYFSDHMLIGGGQFDAAKGKTAELLMLVQGIDHELVVSEITTDPSWIKVSVTAASTANDNSSSRRYRLKIEVPPGLPSVQRGRDNPVIIQMKTNHPNFEDLSLEYAFTSY